MKDETSCKTVGNTVVGVLAHTVHYYTPNSLSCYTVGKDGPRTASSIPNTLLAGNYCI